MYEYVKQGFQKSYFTGTGFTSNCTETSTETLIFKNMNVFAIQQYRLRISQHRRASVLAVNSI